MELKDIREAVARGWCHPKNRRKKMDINLVEAITEEVRKLLDEHGLWLDTSHITEETLNALRDNLKFTNYS
jgi:hypothetical protein